MTLSLLCEYENNLSTKGELVTAGNGRNYRYSTLTILSVEKSKNIKKTVVLVTDVGTEWFAVRKLRVQIQRLPA